MGKKLNTEDFIEKSKLIHNNKYDYSLVEYKNNKTKVKIICPSHGIFEQIACNHLNGKNCFKCNDDSKKTDVNYFISKANEIHNNTYNYSLVNYTNSKTKVKIICSIHGIFEQSPDKHLRKHGCSNCSPHSHRYKWDEIKLLFHNIHGNRYDYSISEYTTTKNSIKIICKKHGVFSQTPKMHIQGQGCPKCGGSKQLTTTDFIEKSNKIHNFLYDYSKSVYINHNTKLIIICKNHGTFEQSANAHLCGQGCPDCFKSKGELKIKNILIENNIKYNQQYFFDDLVYKKPLKFDFGIKDESGNLIYLIEFNGKQHYEYINFIHKTEQQFIISKNRDKLKLDYCSKNKIELYIIKYDDDIDIRLKEIISENNK